MDVSLVIPLRDEAPNLPRLLAETPVSLEANPFVDRWEILLVDDGSTDGTREALRTVSTDGVRALFLDEATGKEAALWAGIDQARHGVVAFMDGDHQMSPDDLVPLLEAVEAGADAAVGVRVRRNDGWMKRISSRVANRVRRGILGDDFQDVNCPLRVVRRTWLRRVPRFRAWHRYLPVLLEARGARVAQIPVAHFPRAAGRSKYGIRNRLRVGLESLAVVRWLTRNTVRYTLADEGARDTPTTEEDR